MLAVQVPLFKQAALGVAALGLVASLALPRHHHHRHHLGLHAPVRCHAIYLTAWQHGDISISRDDAKLETITFETRGIIPDGSIWMGTETLVPIDAHMYRYSYDETILETPPDGTRYVKTPRTGYVVVED